MENPPGSLAVPRDPFHERPPLERIRDWEEMHTSPPEQTLREQGGRCMDCGVPFCHTGKLIGGVACRCPGNHFHPPWDGLGWGGEGKGTGGRPGEAQTLPR